MQFVVLDSTPLALLTQRASVPLADECKRWMAAHAASGLSFAIPEIVDYELRREPLRLGRVSSIARLDRLASHPLVTYQPLTTHAIRRVAPLWADARTAGTPTADPHALDIDVVLAAHALELAVDPWDFVVATSNVGHLARYCPARIWQTI